MSPGEIGRRLGRSGLNLVLSSAGELAARFLGLVYLVVLARYLHPTGFGELNALLAYFVLAMALGSFGLERLALRELSRDDRPQESVFATLLGLRLAASVLSGLLLVWFSHTVANVSLPKLTPMAVALIPAGVASIYVSGFQARERFGHPAVAAALGATTMTAVAFLGVLVGASLTFFLWGVVASEMVRTFWLIVKTRQDSCGHRIFAIDWNFARVAIGSTTLYWILAVLGMIYFRIDLIMLHAMVGGETVGHYASAYRIFDVLALGPALAMGVLFPRFARLQRVEREAAQRLYLSMTHVLLWAGIVVGIIAAFLAPRILVLLFSAEYRAATVPMLWLIVALIFLFWHASNGSVLYAGDRLAPVAVWSTATAGFNVALNWVLIPAHGAAGAAAATAASEVLSLAIFTPMVCRRLSIRPKQYLRAVFSPRIRREDLDLLLGRSAVEIVPTREGAAQ